MKLLCVTVCVSVCLSACAIHPLQEDVTGVSTLDVVKQIRCETRKAAFDAAVRWLVFDRDVDLESKKVGASFYNTNRSVSELSPKLFKGKVARVLNLFWDTGVAYNFAFDTTETNNLNAEINLLRPFTDSSSRLGIRAGTDRQRQNVRTFTITDTFSGLIGKVQDDYCAGRIVTANHVYPIAGRIGMDEVVMTFVNLTLHANLAPNSEAASAPPTMVDSLEFLTTVSGSLNPSVTFAPAGKALRVADASLTAGAVRRDLHKVTVGLALSTAASAQVGGIRDALYANTFFGPLLTATGGPAQRAAANAVNQVLVQQALSRTFVVNQ